MKRPNVLFVMCDQLRADAIGAYGNSIIHTPNLDRLAKRGVLFTKAYSTCPVCIPARYTIRTGCEPYNTGFFMNGPPFLEEGQTEKTEERCGRYLARVMSDMGYRTFGIGKFHTYPDWDEELGFEVHLHSEETYSSLEQREKDAYASFLKNKHPEFNFIEQPHGERTEMYYIPQMSPFPADITVESWAADRAVEQICMEDERPFFGFVSMIGPHPPVAPPIPYNRMYNPDNMPAPVCGDILVDHMDEQLPWMNYMIWAEDIGSSVARVIKARYYGEITYIDMCIGRILNALEQKGYTNNTLVCFFSDHGDHLGDHHSWQKESFFEASCRIPFILSWPEFLPKSAVCEDLVCLTDLFGIATSAAGNPQFRDGIDVLAAVRGCGKKREYLFGYYGVPGTRSFKIMVRDREWKYIYMANGGREQLFNLCTDPDERRQCIETYCAVASRMREVAFEEARRRPLLSHALCGNSFIALDYEPLPRVRAYQFDSSRGVYGFMY